MSADANRTIAGFLVAEFEHEIQTTIRVISALPEDGARYQPDAKSKTGLALVRHIALEDDSRVNGC